MSEHPNYILSVPDNEDSREVERMIEELQVKYIRVSDFAEPCMTLSNPLLFIQGRENILCYLQRAREERGEK